MTATTDGQAVSRLADQVSEIAEIRRKTARHALVDDRDGIMGMEGLQVRAGDDEVAHAGIGVELLVDDARGVLYALSADATIKRINPLTGYSTVLAGGNGTDIFAPGGAPYPANYPFALVNGVGTSAAFGQAGGGLALAVTADVLFVADSESPGGCRRLIDRRSATSGHRRAAARCRAALRAATTARASTVPMPPGPTAAPPQPATLLSAPFS